MGILVLAFLAAVVFFLWLGIGRTRAERAFRAAAVHAEAEITDIDWKVVGPLPDRDRLAVPLVRFTLPDGSVMETRSEVPADGPHAVGDRVGILYLPEKPSRVRLESHTSP